MEITDLHLYMQGKAFTQSDTKIPERLSVKEMKEILDEVTSIQGAIKNIETVETPNQYFKLMPILRAFAPTLALQEEVFYSLKSGLYSTEVPSKVIYAIKEIEKTGALNNFGTMFTEDELNLIFSEGYLQNGYTMYDVICSVAGEFNIITPWKRVVDSILYEGFSEVFIPKENYVAIMPTEIATKFSDTDLEGIEVKKGKLYIGETPLLHLSKLVGVSSGTFDLRDAL